jgi:hypothetical protein
MHICPCSMLPALLQCIAAPAAGPGPHLCSAQGHHVGVPQALELVVLHAAGLLLRPHHLAHVLRHQRVGRQGAGGAHAPALVAAHMLQAGRGQGAGQCMHGGGLSGAGWHSSRVGSSMQTGGLAAAHWRL